MDDRSLRELELLQVVTHYGLGQARQATAPLPGAAVPAPVALRLLLTSPAVAGGAPWMWLAEGAAPGGEGDAFAGLAGKLFDNMLAAIGCVRGAAALDVDDLERQVDVVRPRVIVALGTHAASELLASQADIADLRGRTHRFRDTAVVVTYHPAWLLGSPRHKAAAWEDLLLAQRSPAA